MKYLAALAAVLCSAGMAHAQTLTVQPELHVAQPSPEARERIVAYDPSTHRIAFAFVDIDYPSAEVHFNVNPDGWILLREHREAFLAWLRTETLTEPAAGRIALFCDIPQIERQTFDVQNPAHRRFCETVRIPGAARQP